ncbi:Glycosyl phosphatidyl inositol anchor synthesis [Tieghemiomyces parasiticus]|uniref:GPI ethanolamine phosphate transferase 1 n=1 Tax=Tieghemiomyces parasiticus TaxID=78921 RepID=A0A9W8DMB5_9FUNG|nr:Glycosyl phosphatidyl inositol anchor synthesis [Tieghemiomyces parasiticus]
MALSARNALLLFGVVFHLVYLWSIFDIYFRSPLVHGMTPHRVELPSPARRLVLFVADGLRADKIYEPYLNETRRNLGQPNLQPEPLAPYLRSIIQTRGSWGVSHTRVPTESRPGHVALIAGFYEDVSAVTKGWKMNPVNFDSTFNESRHTWSFGSPDILPMFSHGATNPDHVETFMYGHEDEDFAADGSQLDTWVFNKVHDLFDRADTADPALKAQLEESQVVFFLHLLGLDTNGHAHRPHSNEYLNNIRTVDAGIQQAVDRIESFYGHDGQTAYVFTADHGMNNRGVHGDGHPDNTRTPLIAWGAGVRGPEVTATGTGHDDFSSPWGLTDYVRRDVEQADIAPLMTSLIGVPYPLNSVGVLPLDYLDATPEYRAASAFANARQILEQFEVKQTDKQATQLFFQPYPPLAPASTKAAHSTGHVAYIADLIANQRYTEAERACQELIDQALDGLRYYQTYDWVFLRSTITAGYVGWILYSLLFVIRHYALGGASPVVARPRGADPALDTSALVFTHLLNVFALLVLGALWALLYVQHNPLLYYAYTAFPVYFWCEIVKHAHVFGAVVNRAWLTSPDSPASAADTTSSSSIFTIVASTLVYIGALELLVASYFHRSVLSAGFVGLSVWPHLSRVGTVATLVKSPTPYLWSVFCLATSVFTLLPVEKGEDVSLILAGGILILLSGVLAFVYRVRLFALPADPKPMAPIRTAAILARTTAPLASVVLLVQLALIAGTCLLVRSTVASLTAKAGLPRANQALAWVLLISPVVPLLVGLFSRQNHLHRLVTIYLALAPPFILLSISYEVLFYFCFSVTLLLFLSLEQYRELAFPRLLATPSPALSTPAYGLLHLGDLFTAGQFLFLVNVGFFGTGNVASISSFSLEAVYRLTTIFDPFLMGALLIVKILIPFFLLSSVLNFTNRIKRIPPMALFLLVLATTDIITLNFFYLVRDTGSWLEIGTTISHFCIASLFVLFIIAFYLISQMFTSGTVIVEPMPSITLATKKVS